MSESPSHQRRLCSSRGPSDAECPVAIVGGGPAGMALALALAQRGIASEVIEARAREAIRNDARILALSQGSRHVLERLGAWPAQATPISSVHVSHRHGLGRTRIRAADLDVDALGYVLPAHALIAELDAAVSAAGIPYHDNCRVDAASVCANAETVATHVCPSGNRDNPFAINAKLVAWAEGVVDPAAATLRDYRQHAVLCTVEVGAPHDNVAWERFTDAGPLALLPLGAAYAVVLTVDSLAVADMLALDDTDIRAELVRRFGSRHHFGAVSARVAYPLGLRWRGEVTGPRQVWLGNAAQTLHPVAGQGFNLALRDIWELAQAIRPDRDPGARATLDAYAHSRTLDRRATIGFTDVLIDAFASDFAPLRHARGAGLLALDLFPPLRNFVARRLMFGPRGGV